MKQEQLNSLIRLVMSLVGAFLAGGGGHYFFGQELNDAYWEEITGVILTIISIWWSIKTKVIDIEKLQGAVRQVVTFICGILLAKGILNGQTFAAVIAFSGAIIPYIQAGLSRQKSEDIAAGKIKFSSLKGVDESHIAQNPYVPESKKDRADLGSMKPSAPNDEELFNKK